MSSDNSLISKTMNLYLLLQIIATGFSFIVAILTLWSFILEIQCSFSTQKARLRMFTVLNKLHGDKKVLYPFIVLSLLAQIAWIILIIPIVDLTFSINYISHFEGRVWVNYLGSFSGLKANWYFVLTLFNILVPKGNWVYRKMAVILIDDFIVTNLAGQWGPRKQKLQAYGKRT